MFGIWIGETLAILIGLSSGPRLPRFGLGASISSPSGSSKSSSGLSYSSFMMAQMPPVSILGYSRTMSLETVSSPMVKFANDAK